MGRKRRSTGDHDIGDPAPGRVGDKRPARDPDATPMERIHARRNGDVTVPEPTDGEKPNDDHDVQEGDEDEENDPHYENKEHLANLSDGELAMLENL